MPLQKPTALLCVFMQLSGCTTIYIATVTDSARLREARATVNQCLLDQGFDKCDQEFVCDGFFRHDSTLREAWLGRRLFVGVHETDQEVRVRIVPENGYNEVAATSAKELDACAKRLQANLDMTISPVKYFPDLR
jgi:hypothetical protein